MTVPSIKSTPTATAASVATPTTDSALVTNINGLLATHKKFLSGRTVSNASARGAAGALSKATALLIATPDRDAWNAFVKYHTDNATTVCRDEVGLSGIMTVMDKTLRSRTSFMFMVFRGIVTNHRRTIKEVDFMNNVPVPRLYIYYKRATNS